MFKNLLRISLFAFLFGIFSFGVSSSAFAFSGVGSGTSGDPYQITTCSQLEEMANDLSASYVQENNIDCTGTSMSPIATIDTPFTGSFDGKNYTISNISISGTDWVGLFGGASGTFSNIRLISGSITASGVTVGGLISETTSDTTISHCEVDLTISGHRIIGGLVGQTNGNTTIQKSFYNGTITATSDSSGGLVGYVNSSTTINNSYSTGTMNVAASANGGLVGTNSMGVTITNSYSNATIAVGGAAETGGLVGYNESGSVSDSFSAVTFTGSKGTDFGAVFGLFGPVSVSGIYFDATLAGTTNCAGSGSPTCTQENTVSYYQNNSTNAPMSSWDFTNTWQINSADYSTLRGFMSPVAGSSNNNVSGASPSASAPSCTDAMPQSAPNLFQLLTKGLTTTLYFSPVSGSNSSYVISYGFDENADNFATSFNYSDVSGVIPYSINYLFPGKWFFKVRGQNGCMPGEWSNVRSINVL